jgi:hypothetical protein
VSLVVENPSSETKTARIRIEFLNSEDKVRLFKEENARIVSGSNRLNYEMTIDPSGQIQIPNWSQEERREILWGRLRYRILTNPTDSDKSHMTEGIVSLSEITPDMFDLKVVATSYAAEGKPYRLAVYAAHPIKLHPAKGVDIDAELQLEGEQKVSLNASGVTNEDGYVLLNINLPENIGARDCEIKVTGQRNGITRKAEEGVRVERIADITVSSDKPIYQPGQTLHLRVLMRNGFTRQVIGNTQAKLKISGPDGTSVFRSVLKTSRFGVASVDWPVPANTRLGQYMIEVEIDEGKYSNSMGGLRINISRYDLPNFAVSVKPDRSYYMNGQNAVVEVRADYLFGKPVPDGQVKVVQESSREWNYKEQKWEIEEGEKYEGTTDKSGRFLAHIKLKEHHEEQKESGSRYSDISYAAYVTDPTSKRTEQRRFDLRVTTDAIHIYVVEGSNNETTDMPFEFYVTTSYANGSPAECEVEVRLNNESDAPLSRQDRRLMMTRVRTNRYGIAKVNNLTIPKQKEDGYEFTMNVMARDSKRAKGNCERYFSCSSTESTVIRVETAKTIHRAGEPIHAFIKSNESNLTCIVNLESENRGISSHNVRLRDGQAVLTLPYTEESTGLLTITAYTNNPADEDEGFIIGSRTVLYPKDRKLHLNVEVARDTYRPGEDASVSFGIRDSAGRAVESALGVVVTDQAVEERAQTNQSFGTALTFCQAYIPYQGSIAGVTPQALNELDMSKPLPDGIDLAAELLFNRDTGDWTSTFGSAHYENRVDQVFSLLIRTQLDPIESAINVHYEKSKEYPRDAESFRRILAKLHIQFDQIKDPWGNLYRPSYSTKKTKDIFELTSAGADEKFDTADDFSAIMRTEWQYFAPHAEIINRTLKHYYERTLRFVRDHATLKQELAREGLSLDELRDRWDRPYEIEFSIDESSYTISFISGGPNRRFDKSSRDSDDFTVWTGSANYFDESRSKIESALGSYFKATSRFPHNPADLRRVLRLYGVNFDDLRDGWGRSCYATFSDEIRYADRATQNMRTVYGNSPQPHMDVKPLIYKAHFIVIRSAGADGLKGTFDDFNMAIYSRNIVGMLSLDPKWKISRTSMPLSVNAGMLRGVVTDMTGAVIPGVKVKATHQSSQAVYEGESDQEGVYLLKNLPIGRYSLEFEAYAFKKLFCSNVRVTAFNLTTFDVSLEVAGVSEMVTLTAGASEAAQTETSQLALLQPGVLPGLASMNAITKAGGSQLSTPRLREYFPETLVWQPQIETDANGQARINFKLADNITTWKLAVVASTLNGEIGMAEREIRAFQPFFLEHDPPRFLTEGDEIDLPVIVRNYLDKPQSVDLEIKPESWFTTIGETERQTKIRAGDTGREIFSFRAAGSVTDGKQRITAKASEAGDAIEKPVTVRPDGEEVIETASQIFSDRTALEVNLPDYAIKNSRSAELKIYPNLMSHVVESIEGIIQRPYGCAEQTISSTYPSLLLLRYYKGQGEELPLIAARAQRYVQMGYERLLNYESKNGGFSYWGRGPSNLALTAYALRFLNAASEFVPIDEEVTKRTHEWLIKQQQQEGRWPADYWRAGEETRYSAMLTASITRLLVQSHAAKTDDDRVWLKRSFDYLAPQIEQTNEPYTIAAYALAAAESGEQARATRAIEKLSALFRNEGDKSYLPVEITTPFHGWGLAGNIEATALAVEALVLYSSKFPNAKREDDIINRSLFYLIQQKDRYGVWYSTQATVSVLDALTALLSSRDSRGTGVGGQAEIIVNGRSATTVAMPSGNALTSLITVDLSKFLGDGKNRIEIRRLTDSLTASAQLVMTYYKPWSRTASDVGAKPKENSLLKLRVDFDKREARAGDEITCRVEGGRVNAGSYGMMLAEIGLPPGADVDRQSLERAVEASNWEIGQYDVLPDRVIVYLWPRKEGTRFEFKFRPRYGIRAQNTPSVIYDYYNPEARATVPPVKFTVR